MTKAVVRLVLFAILVSGSSYAQNPVATANPDIDTSDTKPLRELVVTANRGATDRFDTPEAIDIVETKRLHRFRPRSTPEILFQIPGVFVQKTNHGGGSPFVRGLTGNQTLLLLDGVRLNNAIYRYGPNQYLNSVDALSLDRIEILRGSGSVQYGSDAIGGTIQVFMKEPEFQQKNTWSGAVLGRLWSQGMEQSGRAELGFSNKRIAFSGGYSNRHFGDLVGGDTTGHQTPSGYSEQAIDLKSKFNLGQHTVLTLAHNMVEQRHVPVFHKVQLENFRLNEFEPQMRQLSYVRMDGATSNRWLNNWYFIASRQQTAEGRLSQKNGSTVLREERDEIENYGLTSNVGSIITRFWTANSGVELYQDKVGSTRQDLNQTDGSIADKRGLYPDGASMLNFAAFSLHTFDLQPWKFIAGVRFNGYQIDVSDEILGDVQLKPSALVWNVALQRKLNPKTNLFASYHSGFRTPNIDDLGTLGIVDFRYEVPNYSLRPERSHNFQLGFKYQNARLRTETYLFRNELRNLIARVKTPDSIQGYAVYQKENIEQAYIQGIESQWVFRMARQLFFEGHLAYTYGQNVSRKEPVRRIPPFNGRIAIRYQPNKRWFSSAEWLAADAQRRLAQGDRDDNRIPAGGTPGWSVLNLNAGYEGKWLRLHLGLHNLLDRDYRMHGSGVNGVGRSVVLTAECHL